MKSTISNPELLLREYIQGNKTIVKKDNMLCFGDLISLNVNIPLPFIKKSENKNYDLGTIWLYLKFKNEPLQNYRKQSTVEGLGIVSAMDKIELSKYFIEGEDNIEIYDKDFQHKPVENNIENNNLLGKKRENDSYLSSNYNNNNDSNKIKQNNFKDLNLVENSDNKINNNVNLLLTDPLLKMMENINEIERKNINRNSILRIKELSFDKIKNLCRKKFSKEANNDNKNEISNLSISFFEEIVNNESKLIFMFKLYLKNIYYIDSLTGNRAIIMVPPKYSLGNICKINAISFLESAEYKELDPKDTNNTRNNFESFKKIVNNKEITFEIHDTVRGFTKADWKVVVAVFVTGNEYEFREWPKEENVVSILLKVKGFYLKYTDLPTPSNILKWNVKILEIHRHKRYLDYSIQNSFWSILEEFLMLPRYRAQVFNKTN